MTLTKSFSSQYWLLAIGAGIVTIYMTLLWKADDTAHLGMSALFWLAVGSLVWDKRNDFKFQSQPFPTLVGIILIGVSLWKSTDFSTDTYIRLFPFIAGIGLGLIASGFKGLKQYWQEILILFFMGIPLLILTALGDLSPITAKFAAFVLWYMGFDFQLDGVFIYLPNGGVKVYEGCSGISAITYVLGLAVICLVMFPIQRKKHFFTIMSAVLIGFVVNGLRVVLMAILINFSKTEAFHYWHEGDGSLIFGMIAVFLFGGFYWLLLRHEESLQIEQETPESSSKLPNG